MEITNVEMYMGLQYIMLAVWLSISVLTTTTAYRRGLFTTSSSYTTPEIKLSDLMKGFGGYISIGLFIVPGIFMYMFLFHNKITQSSRITISESLWINIFIVLGGFLTSVWTYLGLRKESRQQLCNQTATKWYRNLGMGIISWFIVYPLIMIITQTISHISHYFFPHQWIEQNMIQDLRFALSSSKKLFITMAILTITLVPLIEEFLFRGLLQSWLKLKMGTISAILISSLIFAFVHYSASTGLANIELMSAIFILSCILGGLYVYFGSLWVSIGLHSAFNLMTIIVVIMT